ncbi:MAG: bifunctional diaminohydroxyphosphoribosylaminopyrimidine deaminase/5-amino-6-(5-phosphoribosylamino)uracil reductase RibD, partial [Deltaproteobacteria bacterium]
MEHVRFMRLAIKLAKKGLGRTSPNPAVGSVVVKNGKIIGRGYHEEAGLPHAEVNALQDAGKTAQDSTLYVTLEPCVHFGRTPPCVQTIINSGVKKVVVGSIDPNPKVSGKGIRALKKSGIEVIKDVLRDECLSLNETYVKYITKKTPFVVLKLATTLDGKIATSTGDSKWITSLESRRYVHRLRSLVDCVMVGSGTVLKDDPGLTVRLVKGKNPARAVLDGSLKVSPCAKVFASHTERVFIFTSAKANKNKIRLLEEKGVEVVKVKESKDGLSVKDVLRELGKRGVTSVLIEGGSRLAASALKEGVVDKAIFIMAPKIIGGDGVDCVGSVGVKRVDEAVSLKKTKVKCLG